MNVFHGTKGALAVAAFCGAAIAASLGLGELAPLAKSAAPQGLSSTFVSHSTCERFLGLRDCAQPKGTSAKFLRVDDIKITSGDQ